MEERKENIIAELNTMYESAGWKHFEKWVDGQLKDCLADIVNPLTPTGKAERLRMLAAAYQSIVDKVRGDKEIYKQTSHQG